MSLTTAINTWRDLANAIGVNERTLRKMRTKRGAPAIIDVDAWLQWCRANYPQGAKRLIALRANVPSLHIATSNSDTELADKIAREITTDAEAKRSKDAAAAATAHVKLQKELRQLLPTEGVVKMMEGLAGDVVSLINNTIWLALLPKLDGLTPDHRRLLRQAHDNGVNEIRASLTHNAQNRIYELLTEAT